LGHGSPKKSIKEFTGGGGASEAARRRWKEAWAPVRDNPAMGGGIRGTKKGKAPWQEKKEDPATHPIQERAGFWEGTMRKG